MGATAAEVLAIACPACGAPAGSRCQEQGRYRSPHIKRRARAEMLLGWRRPGISPAVRAIRRRWRTTDHGRL